MSLIQPQERIERQTLTVRLDVATLRALKLYAEYIHSSQEWVVGEGLRLAFSKDDGFQHWLRSQHPDAVEDVLRTGRSRRRAGRATASADPK